MRTEYLQYLLEVQRLGTISAAATKLYLRQSTLSAIIGTLEEEVGVKIFTRSRKGVTPTPEGELVLAFAEEVLRGKDLLCEKLALKNTMRRLVSLIAYQSVSSALGPSLSKSISERFSDISFILHDVPANKVLSEFYNGISKIAIGADDEELIFNYQNLGPDYRFERLFDDHFYLVVSKDSPFADCDTVNLEDLTDEHLVFTHFYPSMNDATFSAVIRRFQRFSVFGTTGVLKKVVLENNMVALMPGLALYNDIYISNRQLRRVTLTGFPIKLANFMVYSAELDTVELFLLEEIRRQYKLMAEKLT